MHPKYLKLFLFLIKVITSFFPITSLWQVIYPKEIKKIMKHLPSKNLSSDFWIIISIVVYNVLICF